MFSLFLCSLIERIAHRRRSTPSTFNNVLHTRTSSAVAHFPSIFPTLEIKKGTTTNPRVTTRSCRRETWTSSEEKDKGITKSKIKKQKKKNSINQPADPTGCSRLSATIFIEWSILKISRHVFLLLLLLYSFRWENKEPIEWIAAAAPLFHMEAEATKRNFSIIPSFPLHIWKCGPGKGKKKKYLSKSWNSLEAYSTMCCHSLRERSFQFSLSQKKMFVNFPI